MLENDISGNNWKTVMIVLTIEYVELLGKGEELTSMQLNRVQKIEARMIFLYENLEEQVKQICIREFRVFCQLKYQYRIFPLEKTTRH